MAPTVPFFSQPDECSFSAANSNPARLESQGPWCWRCSSPPPRGPSLALARWGFGFVKLTQSAIAMQCASRSSGRSMSRCGCSLVAVRVSRPIACACPRARARCAPHLSTFAQARTPTHPHAPPPARARHAHVSARMHTHMQRHEQAHAHARARGIANARACAPFLPVPAPAQTCRQHGCRMRTHTCRHHTHTHPDMWPPFQTFLRSLHRPFAQAAPEAVDSKGWANWLCLLTFSADMARCNMGRIICAGGVPPSKNERRVVLSLFIMEPGRSLARTRDRVSLGTPQCGSSRSLLVALFFASAQWSAGTAAKAPGA